MNRVYLSIFFSLHFFPVINCSQQQDDSQPFASSSSSSPQVDPGSAAAEQVKAGAESKTKRSPHRGPRGVADIASNLWFGAAVNLEAELQRLKPDEYFSSGSPAEDGAFIAQAIEQFQKTQNYNAIARLVPMLINAKAPVTDFARRTQRRIIRSQRDELAQNGTITLVNRIGYIEYERAQAQQKADKLLADAKAQADKMIADAKTKQKEDLKLAQACFAKDFDEPLKKTKKLLKQTYCYEDSNSDYDEDEPTFTDITQLSPEELQALTKSTVLTTKKVKKSRSSNTPSEQIEGNS